MQCDEIAFIKDLGPSMLSVTKTREIVKLKFPGRKYDAQLLGRLLRKGHNEHFGSDLDAMVLFMKEGDRVRILVACSTSKSAWILV